MAQMNKIKQRLHAAAAAAAVREDEETARLAGILSEVAVGHADELWHVEEALMKDQRWAFVREAPASPAEGAAEPVKKYKWATSVDATPTFDPATSLPRENLLDVGWGPSVSAVRRSGAGSLGVFFVNTDKGTVVLKGSRSMASEAFAALLTARLGICTPRWRIISNATKESTVMIARLASLDPMKHAAIFLNSQAHMFLNSFVPGKSLAQFDHASSVALLGPEGSLSSDGVSVLHQIGRVLALDVLLNNGDRLPLIWQNQGNAGNLIIARTEDGPKVYSIDTQVFPIGTEHAAQLDSYHERVIAMLKGLVAGPTIEQPAFAAVRDKLRGVLHYDIGTRGSLALQAGFMDVAGRAKEIALERFELDKWLVLLRAIDEGLVGLDAVQPDFILDIWSIFRAHGSL